MTADRRQDRGLRLCVADAWMPGDDLLRVSWRDYAHTAKAGGYFNGILFPPGFEGAGWAGVFNWVRWWAERFGPIGEVQFWGHGSPGFSFLRASALDAEDAEAWPEEALGCLLWFRTCGTFAGRAGKHFAESWAQVAGVRVAGYTHEIGPLQGGLHVVEPGCKANWSDDEGLTKADKLKSSWRTKHRHACWRLSLEDAIRASE